MRNTYIYMWCIFDRVCVYVDDMYIYIYVCIHYIGIYSFIYTS